MLETKETTVGVNTQVIGMDRQESNSVMSREQFKPELRLFRGMCGGEASERGFCRPE